MIIRLCMLLAVAGCSFAQVRTAPARSQFRRGQGEQRKSNEHRLGIHIKRHASCRYADESKRIISFAPSNQAPVRPVPGKPGCYSIEGPVTVKRPVRGPLQMYVEVRDAPSAETRPTECKGYDPATGCGGFGSCVYCDKCDKFNRRALAHVTITRGGKEVNCETHNGGVHQLEAGIHTDIELEFCMPSRQEFIEINEWDDSVFDQILENGRNGEAPRELVFMSIYIFDIDVAAVARQQRSIMSHKMSARDRKLRVQWQVEKSRAAQKGVPFDTPEPIYGLPLVLNDRNYAQLPLTRAVNNIQYIACHKVYGDMYYDSASVPTVQDFIDDTFGRR